MSADKYPSMFSRQMETIVYLFPNFQNFFFIIVNFIRLSYHKITNMQKKQTACVFKNRVVVVRS